MKKAFLLLALAATTLVGCKQNEANKECKNDRQEMSEHHRLTPEELKQRKANMEAKKAELEAKKAEREAKMNEAWAKFDQLSDEEKNVWIAESKKSIDRRDSIQKAKQAEMEAKWAKFDKATLEEKVELLKMRGVTYREHTHREAPHHGERKHNHDHKAPKYQIEEIKK